MIIKRVSMISGLLHEREIPLTQEEYLDFRERHKSGELIQDILPQLSADDREFLISGIISEEFDEMFAAMRGDEEE